MNSDKATSILKGYAQHFVSESEAEYFAKEGVETHIRKSPRSNPINGLLGDLENWVGKSAAKKIEITEKPGLTKYNFNGLAPSLKIYDIHETLRRKAVTNGISMAVVVNSGGMHTMHLWVQGLAKMGLFAIAGFNGGPSAVVPFNGTKGIFGTNPLTYAFPTSGEAVVVDMATSEIPFFQVMDAYKNNKKIPKNSAVDNMGLPTRNPKLAVSENEISNLLPMGGGYKGYAINYLLEVMTGALIGSKLSTEMSGDYIDAEHGGFIIAIDINSTSKLDSFKSSVEAMNQVVRSQKPKPKKKVIVPGDNNIERVLKAGKRLKLKEETEKRLLDLANKFTK